MGKSKSIVVKGLTITVLKIENDDFISLTDIARNKNPEEPKDVVKNWMRSRTTIEFLGLWEKLYNPHFKGVEFDSFLFEAGSNSFTLSPSKWIEATNAKGVISELLTQVLKIKELQILYQSLHFRKTMLCHSEP